jgi:chromosome segregation ATPase
MGNGRSRTRSVTLSSKRRTVRRDSRGGHLEDRARAGALDSVQSHLAESLRKESTLQAETIARAADAQRQIQEISAAAEQRRVPLLQEIDNLRQRARTLEVSSAVAQSQLAEALAAAKVQEASFQGTVALLDAKTTLVKNQQDRIEELQRAVEVAGHATQKAQASESQALAREAAVRTQLAKREKLVAPRAAGSRKAQPARGPKA